MAIVYLSLGSNLGDRVGYLQQATSLLSAVSDIKIVATSLDTQNNIYDIDYNKKVIVIGNEANGVEAKIQEILKIENMLVTLEAQKP